MLSKATRLGETNKELSVNRKQEEFQRYLGISNTEGVAGLPMLSRKGGHQYKRDGNLSMGRYRRGDVGSSAFPSFLPQV